MALSLLGRLVPGSGLDGGSGEPQEQGVSLRRLHLLLRPVTV